MEELDTAIYLLHPYLGQSDTAIQVTRQVGVLDLSSFVRLITMQSTHQEVSVHPCKAYHCEDRCPIFPVTVLTLTSDARLYVDFAPEAHRQVYGYLRWSLDNAFSHSQSIYHADRA